MKIQGVQVQLYFYNSKYIYSNKYHCTYDDLHHFFVQRPILTNFIKWGLQL